MLKEYDLKNITEPLLAWFAGHARVLPWREDPSPYRVWISEIMLQQTRVEAVKPYFERFVGALPDAAALAACGEDRLLKLWEGLGYYNRVRNLQKAARQIMEEHGGEMPREAEGLQRLAGIGSYTAGAVASIAFGQPAPAVDGNVLRVLTRLAADDTDIMKQSFRREAEAKVTEVLGELAAAGGSSLPVNPCGAFNQALMELGALVCVPNGEPKCMAAAEAEITEDSCPGRAHFCPLAHLCRAHAAGRETEFPVKAKAKARRIEEKTVLVIRDGDRAVLRKRPAKGLLAGMYEFPCAAGHLDERAALKETEALGFTPLRIRALPEAKHIFSHVEWHMTGWMVRVAEVEPGTARETSGPDGAAARECLPGGLFLVTREQTEREFPVPAAYAAYLRELQVRVGPVNQL